MPSRIALVANIGIFDFGLTYGEMQTMRTLNKETRFFNMTLPEVE